MSEQSQSERQSKPDEFEEEICFKGFGFEEDRVEYSLRTTEDTFTLIKKPGSFQGKELVVYKGSTIHRRIADIERLKERLEIFLMKEFK